MPRGRQVAVRKVSRVDRCEFAGENRPGGRSALNHMDAASNSGSSVCTPVPCTRCGYSLQGLDMTGICPECARPIADSLLAHQRHSPAHLPPWLRIYRTAIMTSAITLLAAPFALPPAATALGIKVLRKSGMFGEIWSNCTAVAGLLGIAIFLALCWHRSVRWAWPVGLLSFMMIVIGGAMGES